jgi:hypothetical protein
MEFRFLIGLLIVFSCGCGPSDPKVEPSLNDLSRHNPAEEVESGENEVSEGGVSIEVDAGMMADEFERNTRVNPKH